MEFYIQNVSSNYQRTLKDWFKPGERKDLEEIFKQYSASGRSKAMFEPDEFDKFISYISGLIEPQKNIWELGCPEKYKIKPLPKQKKVATVNDNYELEVQAQIAAIDPSQYKAYHLAGLPYDRATEASTKRIIAMYEEPKELRQAERILSGMTGKEKLRGLIIKRLQELQSLGRYASGASI